MSITIEMLYSIIKMFWWMEKGWKAIFTSANVQCPQNYRFSASLPS